MGALLEQVKSRGFKFRSKTMITDLVRCEDRVAGAVGVDRISGEAVRFKARAVVLSAADCSFRGNYLCVDHVTGDAFALAYGAGVRLNNMEFLCSNTGPPRYGFEGTGVALKFGARLLNARMEPFMRRYHPEGDGAEVSHLVRAMSDEIKIGNGPPFYLDMTGILSRLLFKNVFKRKTFGMIPLNLDRLEEAGVDVTAAPLEWIAAIQTLRGGVHTNRTFASDLPGLFAAGTSQSLGPGLFNGWSTMRAMGSGELAGIAAARFLNDTGDVQPDKEETETAVRRALSPCQNGDGLTPDEVCAALQEVMFPYTVSVRKTERALLEAISRIEDIRATQVPAIRSDCPHELVKAHETRNMVLVAEMCLRSSLQRRESRSDHYRADYPEEDNRHGLKWIHIQRGPGGNMQLSDEPIPIETYPFQPKGFGEKKA
jgi:succinate dehydrogenase/fumarate reductase flavoprotein subunit